MLPDVTYHAQPGFRPLKLDLYLPADRSRPRPIVMWIHGGGWRVGDPRAGSLPGGPFSDWPAVLARLAARGYVVAGVSYRLTGESRFPGAVLDVKAAVRWLKANAAVYGGDPNRVVAWGASAGAQIAALVGTSCGVSTLEGQVRPGSPSACVNGVVDWYGPIAFDKLDEQALPNSPSHSTPESAESSYLGCVLPRCEGEWVRLADPITFLDARDPPFLIMHGDADTTVAPGQSELLHDALQATGIASELVIVPGANHGFVGVSAAAGQPLLDRVFAFIDRATGTRPAN